jgi:hypothetical protein
LFEVDFSESKDHLADRFIKWFKQPAIGHLWREHKNQRSTTRGKPLHARKVRRYGNAAYLCLFEVDLSASKGDLTKQFKKWLAVPENQKRLKRYAKKKRGRTGRSLDRLKDLAAWRLCREMPEKVKAWRHANEYADAHRKTKPVRVRKGEPPRPTPLPFHNAKATTQRPASQAPLFSDASEASDAKRNALTYLAELFPRERWIPRKYWKLSPPMQTAFEKLRQLAE